MNIREIQKVAEDKIDVITKASVEVIELIAKAAWNEAIETAAKVASENGEGCCHEVWEEIRKLKK